MVDELEKQAREYRIENRVNLPHPNMPFWCDESVADFATQVCQKAIEECAALIERQILKRPANSEYVNPYDFAKAIRLLAAPPVKEKQ